MGGRGASSSATAKSISYINRDISGKIDGKAFAGMSENNKQVILKSLNFSSGYSIDRISQGKSAEEVNTFSSMVSKQKMSFTSAFDGCKTTYTVKVGRKIFNRTENKETAANSAARAWNEITRG